MPTTDSHASMADVARRAGVSVSTVSRALRGSDLVSRDTTDRVRAAAEELSFAISRVASGLASGRLGRIGLLLGGSLQEWFNATVIDAVWSELTAADTELTIFRVQTVEERDQFFRLLPARRNTDALLVASFVLTTAERRRLSELGVPIVYLNQRVRGVPSVAIDDVAGQRQGVEALLRLGHRVAFAQERWKPGFSYSAARRVDGFRQAMDAAGVPAAEQQVVFVDDLDSGDAIVDALLEAPGRPTAVAADCDELAFGILAAMARRGLSAPADLSVLGFDDHVMAELLGLSTIAQPAHVIGSRAAALALALAAGEVPDRRNVVVPTHVVLRRTTGPAPR